MKFNKPVYPTVYFSEEIWVKCPSCSEPALVKTELPRYTIPFPWGHKSVCNCNNCGFQEKDETKWSGYLQGFIYRACGKCGTRISHTTEPTKEPYKTSDVTCGMCNGCIILTI